VLRTGRHDHIVDAGADALERHDLEDVLTQARKALAGAVLQRNRTAVLHHAIHRAGHQFAWQGRDERHTAGE
jgi:hypothetical protein